jgi:hypothetical protein
MSKSKYATLKSDLSFPKWSGDVSVDSLRRKLTDAEVRKEKQVKVKGSKRKAR